MNDLCLGNLYLFKVFSIPYQRRAIMIIEQQGQNDAMQNSGMKNDPKWSDAEREKYEGAYAAAKKKVDEQKK